MTRLAVTAFAALAFALPVSAQDQAAIQALSDQLSAALAEGDGAAAADMYTEDARVLPPGQEMIEGRDAIAAFWQAATEGIESVTLTTGDVRPMGDDAVREIGTFRIAVAGDQPTEIAGKYVVVWVAEDDTWKIETDIWNMNE